MADSKLYKFVKREANRVYYESSDPKIAAAVKEAATPNSGGGPPNTPTPPADPNAGLSSVIEEISVDFLLQNVEGYQPLQNANNNSNATNNGQGGNSNPTIFEPTDPRLIWGAFDNVLSFSAFDAEPLVDGFVVTEDPGDTTGNGNRVSTQGMTADQIKAYPGIDTFKGVPSIMNPNAYIGFQQFRGTKDQNYLAKLFDQENQPRWYEIDEANADKAHRYKSPSVSEIVAWSQEKDNADRRPYRFQDFAYCKYWQKIPNNYLVTLRRYPYPTSDNLEAAGENHAQKQDYTPAQLLPVAQAITWLGEATGNKISSILGGIESGLNWKDIKSEMNVVSPASPGDAGAGPMSGIAKWVGLISGDYNSTTNPNAGAPPDPYTEGTWNNKIIGNVNVIDSTKARERGLKFAHKIELVFEYEARSIGGINTKAAMLDIMSNILVLTSATANFWGGANRFRPGSPGQTAPFLGGPAGRAAWMSGDPVKFLDAVTDQFSKAASAISDFLFSAMQNPIEALKSLAAGGAKAYMNSNKTPGGHVSGLKAILTGDPVGEWHVTVGNPFNPMMVIGNLICTGVKIEFNEELGPDDFPTEMKATISLEHGMPRDRDAIESMFNGGGGRLYSLPPGYEESISSTSMSKVDSATGGGQNKRRLGANNPNGSSSNGGNGANRNGRTTPGGRFTTQKTVLAGDPRDVDRALNNTLNAFKRTSSKIGAKWGLGYAKAEPKKD
jgi:hypothetical protein